MDNPTLEERFINFAMEAGVDWLNRIHAARIWEVIYEEYGGRYYHNLNHLEHCFREYDYVNNKLEFPLAIEAALWFHDIKYHWLSDSNEEASAEAAANYLGYMHANFPGMSRVPWLIMNTTHTSIPINRDAQYLQDIDLAILGAKEDDFLIYDGNIRNEYSSVPEQEFYSRRAKILKSFLDRVRIYNTWHFINKYEMRARQNIKMILDLYNRSYGV